MNLVNPTTKYELIIKDLLSRIESGDYRHDIPICTERQLCLDYNVSRITAKRAINELEMQGILYRKRGVGSFVIQNYQSKEDHPLSISEASVPNKTIAFLTPFDRKGGIFTIIESANQQLKDRGYHLSIHIINNDPNKVKQDLRQLIPLDVGGLIYYPITDAIQLDVLNEFVLSEKPVLIIDKDINCQYVSNITIDNFDGGYKLAKHLLELGHHNITFITNAAIEQTSSIQYRFAGFLRARQEAKLSLTRDQFLYFAPSLKEDYIEEKSFMLYKQELKRLYELGVTGFVCENDQVAYTTLRACKSLGLSVPDQVSVCGFDDNQYATKAKIGITTIRQNFDEIGHQVATTIMQSMEDPSFVPTKIKIPVELIVRDSTASRFIKTY